MKSRMFISVLGLTVLFLSVIAIANGNGDVTIKANSDIGSPSIVWMGMENHIEIWITNDAPLSRLSIGLKFGSPISSPSLHTPYGNRPAGGPYYVQEWNTAVGAFDAGGLQVTVDSLTNTILIQGTASSVPLPVHPEPTKCYDLVLRIPCLGEDGELSIDNVYLEPDGPWMFDDGTPYAPTFQGKPNTSMTIPDAPTLLFPGVPLPCGSPHFTTTPSPVETISRCSGFEFTFGAVDEGGKCKGPLVYSSSAGDMNPTTGEFTLSPGPTCEATEVTAIVTNRGCSTDEFTFTVNWIDTPVEFTNCPIATAYIKTNGIYEYPFAAYDPDTCDKITYTAAPFEGPPVGAYDVDSTGKFVFTPAPEDNEYLRAFSLFASSGCGVIDTCQFRVMIGWSVCGDVNSDMAADISDAVYLITYIFKGGLPPNPPLNGDVDCDGIVDIADPVYMIRYIFSGGIAPCAECP